MKPSIHLPVLPVARRPGTNGQRTAPCIVSRGPFRRPQAIGRPTAAAGAPDALHCGALPSPLRLPLAPRRAEREKTAVTTALPAGCLWLWPARPPRFHATLLWAGGRAPETDADARQAPPLAAFRSLPRLPLLLRGHHKGARSRGGRPVDP